MPDVKHKRAALGRDEVLGGEFHDFLTTEDTENTEVSREARICAEVQPQISQMGADLEKRRAKMVGGSPCHVFPSDLERFWKKLANTGTRLKRTDLSVSFVEIHAKAPVPP